MGDPAINANEPETVAADSTNGRKITPIQEADTDSVSDTSESDEEAKEYGKWLAKRASREYKRRRKILDRPTKVGPQPSSENPQGPGLASKREKNDA